MKHSFDKLANQFNQSLKDLNVPHADGLINPSSNEDEIKSILLIDKKDIKDDLVLITIHESGEIKSNVSGRIKNWKYGEDKGWKTAKTNHAFFKPLDYLKNHIFNSKK